PSLSTSPMVSETRPSSAATVTLTSWSPSRPPAAGSPGLPVSSANCATRATTSAPPPCSVAPPCSAAPGPVVVAIASAPQERLDLDRLPRADAPRPALALFLARQVRRQRVGHALVEDDHVADAQLRHVRQRQLDRAQLHRQLNRQLLHQQPQPHRLG